MVETAVERGLSRPELWERIRDAKLPRGFAKKTWFEEAKNVTFTDRLQIAHKLTDRSVLRLVAEYRRYLYLKAVDGGPLAPSMWVDRAWHQHLEMDGGEAWNIFCQEVLRCPVEHMTGLSASEAKASYSRTLDLYRKEFNEEPPTDIWPGDAERRRQALASWIFRFGLIFILLGLALPAFSLASGRELGVAFFFCLVPGVLLMGIGSSWRSTPFPHDPFDKKYMKEANCG